MTWFIFGSAAGAVPDDPMHSHLQLDYRVYPVLVVDDESKNLVTYRYGLGDDFTVITASSGAEALEILATTDIAVLLTDERMPRMTGVELCARARAVRPEVQRIIATAYADLHAAIDAINHSQVHQFLMKPWQLGEVIELLKVRIEVFQHALQDTLGAGLTMCFDQRVTPFERYLIDGLIFGLLGKDTDCEVTQFKRIGNVTLVHIEGSDANDLEHVAVALWGRVWEAARQREVHTARALAEAERARDETALVLAVVERAALAMQGLSPVTREAFSELRDKLGGIELRVRSDAVIEADERRAKAENDAAIMREAAAFQTGLQRTARIALQTVLKRVWGAGFDEFEELAKDSLKKTLGSR